MKEIFINVINRGGYDLTEMVKKINTYHIEGKLTDEERDELYALARGSQVNQYDVNVEIEKLWTAIRELQKANETDTDTETEEETETDTEAEEVYAEFVQPTGAHDCYMSGDKVTYNGQKYICVMDYCVYSPDVYPAGWKVVEESETK